MMDNTTQGDFLLSHGEEHVQCPYALSHVVTNARLIVHLDKCRRAYIKECKETGKEPEYMECRFNWVHRVPKPEIKHHEERCPDRFNVVENIRYHGSEAFTRKQEHDERRKKENEPESRHDRKERERSHKHKHQEKERHRDKSRDSDSRRDRAEKTETRVYRDPDRNREQKEREAYKKERRESRDYKEDSRSSKRHKHSKDVKPNIDSMWGSDAEDWEAGSSGYLPAYQPEEKLKNDVIMYQPRGLSKSERKQFREDQRLKSYKPPDIPVFNQEINNFDSKPVSKFDAEAAKDVKLKVKEESSSDWKDVKVKTEPGYQQQRIKMPPPKVEPVINFEKEDGECSEEECEDFIGDDPFS